MSTSHWGKYHCRFGTFPFETAHRWDLRAVLPLSHKRKLHGRMEAQGEDHTQMDSRLKWTAISLSETSRASGEAKQVLRVTIKGQQFSISPSF